MHERDEFLLGDLRVEVGPHDGVETAVPEPLVLVRIRARAGIGEAVPGHQIVLQDLTGPLDECVRVDHVQVSMTPRQVTSKKSPFFINFAFDPYVIIKQGGYYVRWLLRICLKIDPPCTDEAEVGTYNDVNERK